MGVPSTFSSRTKTARPLALWPVTTVRTFNPCLFSSGLLMVTFLDDCDFDGCALSVIVFLLWSRTHAWQRVSDHVSLAHLLSASDLAMHAAQAPTAEMAVTPPSIRK